MPGCDGNVSPLRLPPPVIEAAARSICDDGILALDGTPATWERHEQGLMAMAERAVAAALAVLMDDEPVWVRAVGSTSGKPGDWQVQVHLSDVLRAVLDR